MSLTILSDEWTFLKRKEFNQVQINLKTMLAILKNKPGSYWFLKMRQNVKNFIKNILSIKSIMVLILKKL